MPQCVDASPFLQRPNVVGQVAGCISNLAPLIHCLTALSSTACCIILRFLHQILHRLLHAPKLGELLGTILGRKYLFAFYANLVNVFRIRARGKTKQLGNNKQTVKAEGRRGRWLGLLWHLPPRLGRESLVRPSPRQATPCDAAKRSIRNCNCSPRSRTSIGPEVSARLNALWP